MNLVSLHNVLFVDICVNLSSPLFFLYALPYFFRKNKRIIAQTPPPHLHPHPYSQTISIQTSRVNRFLQHFLFSGDGCLYKRCHPLPPPPTISPVLRPAGSLLVLSPGLCSTTPRRRAWSPTSMATSPQLTPRRPSSLNVEVNRNGNGQLLHVYPSNLFQKQFDMSLEFLKQFRQENYGF